MIFAFLLCVLYVASAQNAFYSIGFYSGNGRKSDIVNANQIFTASPSAKQIADIASRIGGHRPLLWEENVNLPTKRLDAAPLSKLFLLEVHGGALPQSIQPVIRTAAYDSSTHELPQLAEVLQYLHAHGIEAEGETIQNQESNALGLQKYLNEHSNQPMIILHYEAPSATHFVTKDRILATSNSTVVPLDEQQISQYQICLWTGVMFVLLLLAGVCAIVRMEVIPDSLLYAKFQSSRTESKRE